LKQYVEGLNGEHARRQAYRSGESTIAAEALMNDMGSMLVEETVTPESSEPTQWSFSGGSQMRLSSMTTMSMASALAAMLVAAATVSTWGASGSGGGNEVRLRASMIAGAASGHTDYRERGNQRRLNVEAEDLANTTPSVLGVFVNASSRSGP
jgi:hypothetical protein